MIIPVVEFKQVEMVVILVYSRCVADDYSDSGIQTRQIKQITAIQYVLRCSANAIGVQADHSAPGIQSTETV